MLPAPMKRTLNISCPGTGDDLHAGGMIGDQQPEGTSVIAANLSIRVNFVGSIELLLGAGLPPRRGAMLNEDISDSKSKEMRREEIELCLLESVCVGI